MSQRISLTRIVAINWYGFRQIFDVSDNVLISGGFGTGKSALLDLMQYVLLGEHWRANRAAAGNARGRDLVGYCLGDTNQAGKDGGRHFLRRSGVTLIALEFTRPAERGGQEPKRETWGVRLVFQPRGPTQAYLFFHSRPLALRPGGPGRENFKRGRIQNLDSPRRVRRFSDHRAPGRIYEGNGHPAASEF